ncbi:hypothetical protein FBQ95_16895 [Chloroflexi bacterium CFX3]|nr:hypothetical protein [Chloroflexi bacterium CFX3]
MESEDTLRERLGAPNLSAAEFFEIAEAACTSGFSFAEFVELCADYDLNPYPAEYVWNDNFEI